LISDLRAASPGPQVGTLAPEFKAISILTGDTVDLNRERGKIVIMTFWASWCAPCRRELPILERAQELVGRDRLTVLAVNYRDSREAMVRMKKILAPWQLTVLEDRNGKISDTYKVKAIPHLFMIDREGKIIADHTGYGDKSLALLVLDINNALREDVPTAQPPAPAVNENASSDPH
jgi:thiol-disulfide isomerase/thioredoxin